MIEYFLMFVGALITVWVFARAEECHHCGHYDVVKRSKYGIKGLCARCHKSGKTV